MPRFYLYSFHCSSIAFIFLLLLMLTLSLSFSRGLVLVMLPVYFYKCWTQPESKPYKYKISKRKFFGYLDKKNKIKKNLISPPYIIEVDFCLLLKISCDCPASGLLLRYHDACLDNAAKFANAKLILFSNQLIKKAHTDV